MDTRHTPPSSPPARQGLRQGWQSLPGAAKAAIILAVLGFVVRLTFQSTSTSNGVVTECSYTDIGGIGFGLAAIVAGALTLLAVKASTRRALLVAIGVVSMLVGGLNVARGFGVFHDCGPTRSSPTVPAAGFGPDDAADRAREQLDDRDESTTDDETGDVPAPDGEVVSFELDYQTLEGRTVEYTLPAGWVATDDALPDTERTAFVTGAKEAGGAADMDISISLDHLLPAAEVDELERQYDDVEVLDTIEVDGTLGILVTYTRDDGLAAVDFITRVPSNQTRASPVMILNAVSNPDDVEVLRRDIEGIVGSLRVR